MSSLSIHRPFLPLFVFGVLVWGINVIASFALRPSILQIHEGSKFPFLMSSQLWLGLPILFLAVLAASGFAYSRAHSPFFQKIRPLLRFEFLALGFLGVVFLVIWFLPLIVTIENGPR